MEADPCECLGCGTPLHVFPPEVAAVIRDDNPVAVSDELATFSDRDGTRYALADDHGAFACPRCGARYVMREGFRDLAGAG